MEMNIQPAVIWAGAISSFLALGTAVWNLLTSGSKKNSKKLDDLDIKVTAQDKRLQSVENELKHLPSKDQVAQLRVSIAELEGTVKELGATLKGTANTVKNIDSYLRKDER